MNYSLSYTLGNNGRGVDPSATRYIAAVRAAGATVDSNQVGEINTFYKAAKTGGYYTSLKRLYLPIWGVAAANAIDMIGLTSGTFNGGVTHGAGFVQSNGTTGWFDFGSNPATLGMGQDDHYLVALSYELTQTADWDCLIGCGTGANLAIDAVYGSPNSTTNYFSANNGTGRIESGNNVVGIYSMSRTGSAGASVINAIRRTAGRTTTIGSASTGMATSNIAAMSFNVGGSPSDVNAGKMGLYGAGLGLSDALDSALTLSLKNMWESATSLTLP